LLSPTYEHSRLHYYTIYNSIIAKDISIVDYTPKSALDDPKRIYSPLSFAGGGLKNIDRGVGLSSCELPSNLYGYWFNNTIPFYLAIRACAGGDREDFSSLDELCRPVCQSNTGFD
jgi:hypothetical protein